MKGQLQGKSERSHTHHPLPLSTCFIKGYKICKRPKYFVYFAYLLLVFKVDRRIEIRHFLICAFAHKIFLTSVCKMAQFCNETSGYGILL